MTYSKEARIAELKAMPRPEVGKLARSLGISVHPGKSFIALCREVEAQEFKDLRHKACVAHIKDLF